MHKASSACNYLLPPRSLEKRAEGSRRRYKTCSKNPAYKGLCYSTFLYEEHASLDSQYWWLLAPSPPLQPKSSKCSAGVPKGRSISQNCSRFTETLNFHIFMKFYLYIRCANELLNQQSEPGTGNISPWQTCQCPYPLFQTPPVMSLDWASTDHPALHITQSHQQLFCTALCKHMYHS